MPGTDAREKMTRENFLKIAFGGIPAAALLFASGCAGEEDDDDEEEDDD